LRDKAIELKPDCADAWNNKGVTLQRLEEYEEARKCYGKALDIDPSNSMAQNNLNFILK
jgi:Flp pilus assembly protein TadD